MMKFFASLIYARDYRRNLFVGALKSHRNKWFGVNFGITITIARG